MATKKRGVGRPTRAETEAKYQKFVAHYVEHGDEIAAFLHAGWRAATKGNVSSNAGKILRRPRVVELLKIARGEVPAPPKGIQPGESSGKDPMEKKSLLGFWSDVIRGEVHTYTGKDGVQKTRIATMDERLKASSYLAKALGVFTDKSVGAIARTVIFALPSNGRPDPRKTPPVAEVPGLGIRLVVDNSGAEMAAPEVVEDPTEVAEEA